MRRIIIIFILIALVGIVGTKLFIGGQEEEAPFVAVRDDSSLRATTSGQVVGFKDRHDALSWQGIPYAQPPVGPLRWRAPQPVVTQSGLLEALTPGNICPQLASVLSAPDAEEGTVVGDENCLYLNVWSPPDAAKLPVMLWIHGGSNTFGDGGSYNGAALAGGREVVVVTINYRLGIFGWFSHPALQTGNPLHDSGNFGTLDVLQALHWLRDNIAQFGGDPQNITLFGESSGGYNTLTMMASPLAKGLFHKAIVQSGGLELGSMQQAQSYTEQGGHRHSSQEIVAKLLVAEGRATDRQHAKDIQAAMSTVELKEYLYQKTAVDLFAQLSRAAGTIDLPTVLADGQVLPNLSNQEIFSTAANHNMVPTILGTNRDETALFMAQDPNYIDFWLGFLPRVKDPEVYRRTVRYGSLAWKARGVDSLAQYMTAAGNPQVFAYRFDWDEEPSQFGFDLSLAIGAGHAMEIPFIFGDFETGLFGASNFYPNDQAQADLATSMASYWSEFAYTGDPDKGRLDQQPDWLAWGQQGMHSIILDSPADQGIFMDSTVVTAESIKAELTADQSFSEPAEQCGAYARNFRGEHFDQNEYEALNEHCALMNPASFTEF